MVPRYKKTEVTAVPIIAYHNTRERVIKIFFIDWCWPNLYESGRFLGVRHADFWSNLFPDTVLEWAYKAFYVKCFHIPMKRVLYVVPAILQQATSPGHHLRFDQTSALFSEDMRLSITKDAPEGLPSWTHISHVEVYLRILFMDSITIAINRFNAWIWKGLNEWLKSIKKKWRAWRFERLIDYRI